MFIYRMMYEIICFKMYIRFIDMKEKYRHEKYHQVCLH